MDSVLAILDVCKSFSKCKICLLDWLLVCEKYLMSVSV